MTLFSETSLFTRKAIMLSVLFLTVFFSCKKDGELYPKFNDENLTVNYVDTFTINTSVVRDSIQTNNAYLNLLGICNDSVFGLSSSSIYSQVTLLGANVNFGSNPVIDSVVLTLKYQSATSFYGNLSTPMTINVYQLAQKMTEDKYYATDSVLYNNLLGASSFSPYVNDSVKGVIMNGSDTIDLAPHIRITLNNTLGQTLLDLGGGSNTIESNTELENTLNGLYITPSTSVNNSTLNKGEGSILYLDLNDNLSTLTLFYHNDNDTNSYSFLINSESKKFNHFEHNYTNTNIGNQLTGLVYDSSLTYIQSMGGLRTKITLPYIKNLKSIDNIIINKAELVFTVNESLNNTTPEVQNTSLTGIDQSGTAIFLADNFEGSDYFGGSLDESNFTYTFNIARHIQQLLNSEEEDYGLYLIPNGSAVSANRSIINSAKHPSSPLKLKITYSKP